MTASHAVGPAAPNSPHEYFVDGDTAALFFGITRRTLLQKVRDGKIPGHALDPSAGKKDWRFLLSELHAYMVSCETAATWSTQTTKEGLMPRYQIGSLRKIMRAEGLTWVLRYYATRSDGKRVERTTAIGLVKDIGPTPADASREVDRQKLRETINQLQPFQGKPRTFGQLCQDYIENELRIDQSESARPKAFPTVETYERHLINRIIPRWGKLAPLAVESRDVEAWFRELRKGNAQKKVRPLADPTIDKIRRIMSLVFKHGQRCNFLPRQQEGNPMNWVSQRTTSDYRAIVMTPKQAFEVLLEYSRAKAHVDSKRRGHCSAGIRTVGLDVDGSRFRGVGDLREKSLCVGKIQRAEVESVEGSRSHASAFGWLPPRMARKNEVCQGKRLCVSQRKAERQEAAVRVHHGAEIFAPRSHQRRRDSRELEGTLRLSQLSPFAGNGTSEAESGPENRPRCAASRGLRHNDGTLCAVRHGRLCGMRKASSWNSSWETEFTCSRSEFSENHGLDRGLEISALRR